MSLKDKARSKLGLEEGEEFRLEDLAVMSLKIDDAAINRKDFLQETLQGKYPQETIDKAISETPSAAGITQKELNEIAEQLLELAETNITLGAKKDSLKETMTDGDTNILQKAKGAVDTLLENRYKNEGIRLAQKLLYLYGFPEIQITKDGMLSGEKNKLLMILCTACMFGVEDADTVLRAMARAIPEMEDKKISIGRLDSDEISEVLTAWGHRNLGKGLITRAVSNVPLVGNVFRKMNYTDILEKNYSNLVNALSDTALSDPQHVADEKELAYAEKLLALIQD